MSDGDEEAAVGLTPGFRKTLSSILAHAATQDRTVIEFRTTTTQSGGTHLSAAIEVTEHVATMEDQLNAEPPHKKPPK